MQQTITMGRVRIGKGLPTAFIAEAACEHLGSVQVAKQMVDAAKEAGADFIKFQMHLPQEMVPGSIQFWGGSMDDVLARYNLRLEDHEELFHYCDKAGIQYLCTPFCADAGDILDRMGVPGFKTGSGEMTNHPMLRRLAKKGKPMIVSTGMATFDEIKEAAAVVRAEGAPLVLTHCTSAYPPRYDQINLRFIDRLREELDVPVGHSDHTPDIWTALGAVSLGAVVVEKHFTIDRRIKGPDWHVSLEPQELKMLIDGARKLEAALGDTKTLYEEERVVRDWAHHSVVTVKPVKKGAKLTRDMLDVKRPGRGVPAKHMEELAGRVATRDLAPDHIVQWEDVS